jgi:hypothetical protein
MLPTKKRQKKKPTTLPKDFLRSVSELFSKQFKSKVEGATFLVYGDLYGDEAVLCVSLSHPKSLRAASFHLSSELPKGVAENPEKVTERLKSMVDVAASWFSQCFQSGTGLDAVLAEMADSDPNWQEFEWEGNQLFVKLNRDNYALESAASNFLKKAGFEDDGGDVLENDEDGEGVPS